MKSKYSIYLLIGLVFAVYLLACWRDLLLNGLVPVDGNMMRFGFPQWAYFHTAILTPRHLLWTPLANMGEPFLADPQTMATYPVLWLLAPFSRFLTFIQIWVILHTFLATALMALLAWQWYRDSLSALAAGLLFGFNGFLTARVTLMNHFASAAYLPAILYFLDRESPIGFGLMVALQWTAGFPPFSFLSVLISIALAFYKRGPALRCFLKGSLWALGFSAVQWIPFLEMLHQSSRPLFLNPNIAMQFSIPGKQLLKELFLPQWYAFHPALSGDPAIVCFYVGFVTLLLAGLGAIRGSRRERIVALCLGVTLLLSMGGYLPGYRYLTVLHLFRFPANWLLGATLGITLLCASGIHRLPSIRWKGLALSVLALDLLVFAQYTRVAWSLPSFLEKQPELAQITQRNSYPTRMYHSPQLITVWTMQGARTADDFLLMKELLIPSYGTAFGIPETSSYEVLRSQRASTYQEWLQQAGPHSSLWDEAGISTVFRLAPGSQHVDRTHVEIWENKHPFPPIYLADGAKGQTRVLKANPGIMDANVILQNPGRVVFREVNYPGWRGVLDGNAARLETFKDTFLALSVPGGQHTVEFKYQPVSVYLGLCISLATFAFLLIRRMIMSL